jgi:hypothetical protein
VRLTEAAFFKGYAKPRALYRSLKKLIAQLGPVETEVTRSQVGFRARTRFAWAWLPQKWLKNVPQDGLVLTFDLPRKLRSKRFKEIFEVRKGRFTHHLVLSEAAQLDGEVRGWLDEARRHAL